MYREEFHNLFTHDVLLWVARLCRAKYCNCNCIMLCVVQGRRVSAAFSLPPLEYEATAELQRELEAAAPDEFMCPLGR
jgi:hypothetical protein